MKKMQNHGHKPTMKQTPGHSYPKEFGFAGGGDVRVRAHYRRGGRVENGSALTKTTDTVENVETGMAGKEFRPGFAKGGKAKHEDVKMDKAVVKKAVHAHEKARHPGSPLTKLAKGGMPAHNRKPMVGC